MSTAVAEKAVNPFGSQKLAAQANAVAESDQQRAIAETQAAMVIAKRFPRDQIAATDRILQACTRQQLAESALYSYSRGGSEVTGPSIRMAEALAQNWGNIQFGIRELEQRNGESSVEAFAWDIETNTRQVKVFQVPHLRYTRQGSKRLEDPRDIYEMVANQGARRLRACILGVIPGDVIEAAVDQCELTLKASVDVTPELIKTLLDKFAEYGVSKEQIEKRIQRRIESIQPAAVVQLRKIFNSMKDGMSTAAEWFEILVPVDGGGVQRPTTGASALKAAVTNTKPATGFEDPEDPTTKIAGAGVDKQTGEIAGAAVAAAAPAAAVVKTTLFEDCMNMISAAQAMTDSKVALIKLEDVDALLGELGDTNKKKVKQALAEVRAEIEGRQ